MPREPRMTTQGGPRPPIVMTGTSTSSSGNICAVTPSDAAGSLDNLVRRVEAIEAVLASLLGLDVTANQLSDLSGAGGVITDLIATSSNEAGGWVTDGTFTGVAISTLGWGFYDSCTGEMGQWPIVTLENGVLKWGASTSGCIGGESAVGGGGACLVVTMNGTAYTVQKNSGITITTPPNVQNALILAVSCPPGAYIVSASATFFNTFSKYLTIEVPSEAIKGIEAISAASPFGTPSTIHPAVNAVLYSTSQFIVELEGGDPDASNGRFSIVQLAGI